MEYPVPRETQQRTRLDRAPNGLQHETLVNENTGITEISNWPSQDFRNRRHYYLELHAFVFYSTRIKYTHLRYISYNSFNFVMLISRTSLWILNLGEITFRWNYSRWPTNMHTFLHHLCLHVIAQIAHLWWYFATVMMWTGVNRITYCVDIHNECEIWRNTYSGCILSCKTYFNLLHRACFPREPSFLGITPKPSSASLYKDPSLRRLML